MPRLGLHAPPQHRDLGSDLLLNILGHRYGGKPGGSLGTTLITLVPTFT